MSGGVYRIEFDRCDDVEPGLLKAERHPARA
jgi:hypothetical protein